jgi:predicted Rossmann-fold nucleotide-binding protein
LNQEGAKKHEPLLKFAPKDNVFTVFIAGGHANDSAQDIADAKELAKFCAAKGYRIVTGAGALRGSMGATHTGFIEYHLEHMKVPRSLSLELKEYKNEDGTFQTERLIRENAELVNKLTDGEYIPRDMFYGFSVDSLLKMEGLKGEAPPGITYTDTGNRVRRMQALLDPQTAVIMPGGPGTLEEIVETLDKKLNPKNAAYNPKMKVIIYNNEGRFSKILEHYGIYGDDYSPKAKREMHDITVINGGRSIEDIKVNLAQRAEELAKVKTPLAKARKNAVKKRDEPLAP